MKNATQGAESVTLYFKEGSSDKVYAAQIEQSGKGWLVNFQYGRRGSTMNTGSKTPAPLPFEKAKGIFDKLVAEKTSKGYTTGEDGATYTHTSSEVRDTGERPQLLNDITEEEAERLIEDPAWGMQEKMDGRRRLAKKQAKDVSGINKKGLTVDLPSVVVASVNAARSFSGGVIDGEAVGDTLFAFDLLDSTGGITGSIRGLGYLDRYKILSSLGFKGAIQIVPLAVTTAEKRALFEKVKAAGGEGVVFKRLDAPYKAGRPNSGGDQLKFKFYAMGSFIVSKVNAKRSVALEVLFNGKRTSIGNVTITPNKAVPAVGDVVEIRYLYCFKGGSLYQPTFLAVRDDVDADECVHTQLKYKSDDNDEEA